MARTMTADGNCFRAVLIWHRARDNSEQRNYFGPFDEPGKAKAARTRFKNGGYRYSERSGDYVIDEYVEVSDTWRMI